MKKPELPLVPSPAAPPRTGPPLPAPAPVAPPRPRLVPSAGQPVPLDDPAPEHLPEPIIGVDDRAARLAMVNGTVALQLRGASALAGKDGGQARRGIGPLRPGSRLACERRCGPAGQCDPSSPYGCGGEFCRGREGRLY